ncbi:hypothetical protein [Haloferax larsenii]|uniref:DUF8070 domain-containing protein n=1 Tax=Haloferax larsenii TaxID=302484 RepID=A0A1H7IQU2_HALLR|nr:hypothetical protein [Haloferax larsenii]ELZ82086.1 hypothetical protein C455_02714 [Haloferax larsenii JCM 13917]UVE49466.1 hypothetical protein KU306_11110 [Haloferax larsenii]SEK63145.1 hypothetical protein SAMN04488691_101936 [Haloferax larsenii]
MDKRAIAMAVLVFTIIAGLATVGTIYYTTHSGLYLVFAAIAGLLLLALGGGQAGRTNVTEGGVHEEGGIETEANVDIHAASAAGRLSIRLVLICYGIGIFLWSVIILQYFRSGLH